MNRFEREDSVCSDRDRPSTTFRLYGNKDNDYKKYHSPCRLEFKVDENGLSCSVDQGLSLTERLAYNPDVFNVPIFDSREALADYEIEGKSFETLAEIDFQGRVFLGYDFVDRYLNVNLDQNEATILIGDTLFEFGPADVSVVLEYLDEQKEQSSVNYKMAEWKDGKRRYNQTSDHFFELEYKSEENPSSTIELIKQKAFDSYRPYANVIVETINRSNLGRHRKNKVAVRAVQELIYHNNSFRKNSSRPFVALDIERFSKQIYGREGYLNNLDKIHDALEEVSTAVLDIMLPELD